MSHGSPLVVAALAFGLVFLALGALAALLFTLRALATRAAARRPAPGEIDPETLAVLAAALHATLGAPVRLHRVHVHGGPSGENWERAGRMDIMLSHRVMPK